MYARLYVVNRIHRETKKHEEVLIRADDEEDAKCGLYEARDMEGWWVGSARMATQRDIEAHIERD